MKNRHTDTLNSPPDVAKIQNNNIKKTKFQLWRPNSSSSSTNSTSCSNSCGFTPDKRRHSHHLHTRSRLFFAFVPVSTPFLHRIVIWLVLEILRDHSLLTWLVTKLLPTTFLRHSLIFQGFLNKLTMIIITS